MNHLRIFENEKVTVDIESNLVISDENEEFFGDVIDPKVTFKDCIKNLCAKMCQKLSTLVRNACYMNFGTRKTSISN